MKYTKEMLSLIVLRQKSIAGVLKELNLTMAGGNYTHIKSRLVKFNIDFSHFTGQAWSNKCPGKRHTKESFINEVLILNGKGWNSSHIKQKLIFFDLKEDICEECGQLPIWNNKLLTLQLHHDNYNRKDNRLGNLKILCPNCHTQTKNHSSTKKL